MNAWALWLLLAQVPDRPEENNCFDAGAPCVLWPSLEPGVCVEQLVQTHPDPYEKFPSQEPTATYWAILCEHSDPARRPRTAAPAAPAPEPVVELQAPVVPPTREREVGVFAVVIAAAGGAFVLWRRTRVKRQPPA